MDYKEYKEKLDKLKKEFTSSNTNGGGGGHNKVEFYLCDFITYWLLLRDTNYFLYNRYSDTNFLRLKYYQDNSNRSIYGTDSIRKDNMYKREVDYYYYRDIVFPYMVYEYTKKYPGFPGRLYAEYISTKSNTEGLGGGYKTYAISCSPGAIMLRCNEN